MAGIDRLTELMLHCNGADAATTFTDNSYSSRNVTAVGNAQLDTAQKKFGTASGVFDGTGDGLTVPAVIDWNFDGDFAIDFWLRNNVANNRTIIKSVSNEDWNSAATGDWILALGGDDKLSFYVKNSGTAGASGTAIIDGTWYHVAILRHSNITKLYLDGTADGGIINSIATFGNTQILNIGAGQTNLTVGSFDGWLDEIRITKGNARWSANFTPATKEYTKTNPAFLLNMMR